MLKTSKIFVRLLLVGSVSAALLACQSSSQSSSSSGMPVPSSPSSSSSSSSQQSSSSSQSQGSRSSQSSQSSQSSGSPSRGSQSSSSAGSSAEVSSSGTMPTIPGGAQSQQQGSSSTPSNGQSSGQGARPQSGSQQQGNSNQANNGGNPDNNPSQNAGTQPRFPGDPQSGANGSRDGSSGDLNSGATESFGGNLPGPSGDYSLDTLPSGVLSGTGSRRTSQDTGAMTAAERAAVFDERLRKGYEAFDGFILSERERAQNESNAAGSIAVGGAAENPADQPQTLEETVRVRPADVLRPASSGRGSESSVTSFPIPEDIPEDTDEDAVALQIKEAAMTEPDPELRELLWEEYRKYTGIGI